MPKSGAEEWTLPLRAYYRSIYLECVDKACTLLLNTNRPGEVIRICGQSTSLEPFEERLHELLIRGYLQAENHTQALAHYYQVTNMFYSELGVKVSDSITNLYREITKSVSNVEADLRIIEQQLHESEAVPGAFFCDYEVFRNLYRIQSRSILRTGQSFMLALLTVSDGQDQRAQYPASHQRHGGPAHRSRSRACAAAMWSPVSPPPNMCSCWAA